MTNQKFEASAPAGAVRTSGEKSSFELARVQRLTLFFDIIITPGARLVCLLRLVSYMPVSLLFNYFHFCVRRATSKKMKTCGASGKKPRKGASRILD